MDHERRKRILKRCTIALTTFALGLLALEAVLHLTPLGDRIYYTPPIYVGEREPRPSGAYEPDPHVGWRMRPESSAHWPTEGREIEYWANAKGFRTGRNRDTAQRPKRIAFLGDSYAWGFGVHWEETAAALLEEEFENCTIDLLAMPGFGLDQIMESTRLQAIPEQPDLAIVAIFSGDLSRCFTAYRNIEGFSKPLYHIDDGNLVASTPDDQPGRIQRFLENNSKLYAVLWTLNGKLGKHYGIGSWWALNRALLQNIQSDLEAADIPALFVHIPDKCGARLPALTSHLRASGAHLIDLAELDQSELRGMYFETDGHFSPAGQRKLAEVVTGWIDANFPQLR